MRINQFLAAAGLGSRRACEKLALDGKVSINGKIVRQLATRVSPNDFVAVNGKPIQENAPLTIMLNKPKGYVCSRTGQDARKTIFELLPKKFPRLFYVGRLDADTEGLLILTNRGEFAQKLAHPKYKLPKTYHVRLDRPFDFNLTPKFLKGFSIASGHGKFESIHRRSRTTVKVVLSQGLKRQIRWMFAKHGYEVIELCRVQIGGLMLENLLPGQWRILSKKEIDLLTFHKTPK